MLLNQFRKWNLSRIIIARQKWTDARVSSCGTYHICSETQQPLYARRFKTVLPFHLPGLAPVVDLSDAAFHINDRGEQAYTQRFDRTFGFYQELAAVQKNDKWHHITPYGSAAYDSVWQWCGNFQSYRCPVRDFNLAYYHIDPTGRIVSGPNSYAGDFREGSAVVRSPIDGLFRAVDQHGCLLHPSGTNSAYFDLDIYHKGLARARDADGWFFIDRAGRDTGQGRRYRQIENFYNGQALVQLLHDGSRCIIDEKHRLLARLADCNDENRADIEQLSKAYFLSFALKMGLEQKENLLGDDRKMNSDDYHLREQIRQVWTDLGILEQSVTDGTYTSTKKGHLLLDSNSLTRDRALYWLQDRFLSSWLPTSIHSTLKTTTFDIFSEISNDPMLVTLSQRVLNSYAEQDWQGITSILPSELLQAPTIADLGGGLGALLRELSVHCPNSRLICIDRPEVIRLATSHPHIEFTHGDLFSGPLPPADFYLLSRILHDWPDEIVHKILNRIPSNHLCVIDREMNSKTNRHGLLSLHMYLLQRARERSRQEWDDLFTETAWRVQSRTPFSGHMVTVLTRDENVSNKQQPYLSECKIPVRKVILPMAGLATRMRPQSRIIPKILLPIVQSHSAIWTCRPALDLLLEEIFAEGTNIEQVILVIAPEQLCFIQPYLNSKYSRQTVDYVVQPLPNGFGHAVLQTEHHIGNEPFVVMLGDHLFQSNDDRLSCFRQILNAYRQYVSNPFQTGLTGVMTCARHEIAETGLLQSATVIDNSDRSRYFEIIDMAEKPSIKVALDRFQSSTFNDQFLCQAGIDILPPAIFALLRQREQITTQSELGLREAMNDLRQKGQLHGYLLNGHRYDIGNPREYYRTFWAFANEQKRKVQKEASTSDECPLWPFVKRLERVCAIFSASQTPVYSASAPGRLDVMGGFADYSGAHVLQYPIAQRTYAFVQASNRNTVRMISIQADSLDSKSIHLINENTLTIWEREMPLELLSDKNDQTLRKRLQNWYDHDKGAVFATDEPRNWPNYVLGLLAKLIERKEQTSIPLGFNVVIISDVPCNKGVASSAALEVAVAWAASACLGIDQTMSGTQLALLCQHVENHAVGSSCGFMDQMTCVHGSVDHLFSLVCQHLPEPPFHNVSLPPNVQLFGIDSGVKRSTASTAYRRVRTAAFMGKQMMNLTDDHVHLCQISLSEFNLRYRGLLPEKMSGADFSWLHLDPLTLPRADEMYMIRAATAHPIEENFRVQMFEKLLQTEPTSDESLVALGELMFQSDAGYTSCGLHSEETRLLVNLVRQHKSSSRALFGAKITGGGGGGTVAILARDSSEAIEAVHEVVKKYESSTGRPTRIFIGSSSGLTTYSPVVFRA